MIIWQYFPRWFVYLHLCLNMLTAVKSAMAYLLSISLICVNFSLCFAARTASHFDSIRDKSPLLSKFSHIEIGASDILKTDAINIFAVRNPRHMVYAFAPKNYCSLPGTDKRMRWAYDWMQLEFSLTDRLIHIATGGRTSFHGHPLCQEKGFQGWFLGLVLAPHAFKKCLMPFFWGIEFGHNLYKFTGVYGVVLKNEIPQALYHVAISTYFWQKKTLMGRANLFLSATPVLKIENIEDSLLELSVGFKWELPSFLTLSPKWIRQSSGKHRVSLAIDFIPFSPRISAGLDARPGLFNRPDMHLPDALYFENLSSAVKREDAKAVKRLLKSIKSPIFTLESDRSVLEIAAKTGNTGITEALIKYGAFFANQNLSAFIHHNRIAQNPLDRTLLYQKLYLSSGYTALQYAIQDPDCSRSMQTLLLNYAAKTDSMLDIATERFITQRRVLSSVDLEIACTLLQRGGNINLKVLDNQHASFERLLIFGASLVSDQANFGQASINRFVRLLETCIHGGANPLALHSLNSEGVLATQTVSRLREAFKSYLLEKADNAYHIIPQKRRRLDWLDLKKEADDIAVLLNAKKLIQPYFEAYMEIEKKLRKEFKKSGKISNQSILFNDSLYYSEDEYAKFTSIANEALWWRVINIRKALPREIFEMIQNQLVRAQLMEMIYSDLNRFQSNVEMPQTLLEYILKLDSDRVDESKVRYLKQRAVQLFCESDEVPEAIANI